MMDETAVTLCKENNIPGAPEGTFWRGMLTEFSSQGANLKVIPRGPNSLVQT